MPRPDNGMYIIQGEVNLVVTAMRRNSRWASHTHQDDEQDPLLGSFSQLKDILNNIADLDDLAPNEFLSPFLDVIRSEDTTGPITGLALTSVNKFLSYGLIDPSCDTAAAAIENIADAVTHARFVGTDPGSDEVVLMKILHVLRTLLLTPAGAQLTNESVCEIMQSCFRICFEMRLSELLRKSAEHTLMDMVQLLFSRLPQFKEDAKWVTSMKKLKMRAGGMDSSRGKKKKRSPKPKHKRSHGTVQSSPRQGSLTQVASPDSLQSTPALREEDETNQVSGSDPGQFQQDSHTSEPANVVPPDSLPTPPSSNLQSPDDTLAETTIATTPVSSGRTVVDIHEGFKEASDKTECMTDSQSEIDAVAGVTANSDPVAEAVGDNIPENMSNSGEEVTPSSIAASTLSVPAETLRPSGSELDLDKASNASDLAEDLESSVHSAAEHSDGTHDTEYINPRGVRFMPHQQAKDGSGPLIPYGLPCVRELFRFLVSLTNPLDRHNTDVMIHMGLSLLTAALESGADHISSFTSLLVLVKDDCCKNLFFLLKSERLSLFAASIRVCFLLFESMRSHLKLQLEMYVTKLMDIIVSETPRISYEQREIALESVVQLMRIPGLVTELYLNYDCDLYCSSLFEDLMKLLSKNAFPVSGLFTTHLLSLDALLAVIDSIEQHCHHRILHTAKMAEAEGKTGDTQTPTNPEVKVTGEETTSDVADGTNPPLPPISGYAMATRMSAVIEADSDEKNKGKDNHRGPRIRPNRMKVNPNIPTEEDLAAIKHKKKLYQTGTEQFNIKPSKGIAFLQEQGLLSHPLDPEEVVAFIKGNPKLDKNQIGEYISNKKNSKVLEAFQKSFVFEETRVDESLRMYLETFRLPGEAPVISYLLEHFAEHWHKTNGEPFANADAAYTLAYAVIMLNVDQHNQNAKKQNIPMTISEFKRNLSKVNGGQDFEEEMLDEIYHSIKSEEIVMPAEHVGLVRENYLWKVLLRRGASKEGSFIHVPTGAYDRDLFSLVWGPTVAALSFVFDKSLDETIIQKAVSGFRKCAMISAHYGLSDVFDNLVISLCKFTTLLSAPEAAESIPIHFGNNKKAQLAAKTVFGLAHRHGDILREGWKNILDCMLQLYRAKLMPDVLVTVEDFVDPDGRISLVREEVTATQKSESGMLSSIFSIYFTSETPQQRGPSPEEQEAIKRAKNCIDECHVEQLINESKFLMVDSLQELLKALIFASRCPEVQESMNGTACDEDATVFYLELLIHVVWVNRDRIAPFWPNISQHLHNLVVNATERTFLVERAVVGLLRLAIKLLRREEIAPQVLESLQMLLLMKPEVIHSVSRQVSFALHNLLKTNAANIHSAQDWYTLFTLLEVVGAGANPPPLRQVSAGVNVQEILSDAGAQSDSEVSMTTSQDSADRGYTSDSEISTKSSRSMSDIEVKPINSGSWLMVYNKEEGESHHSKKHHHPVNQFNIALNEKLRHHDTKSLMKSCETLAFLVRDAAHVTPHNFESCVHAIRTFVEASMNGGHALRQKFKTQETQQPSNRRGHGKSRKKDQAKMPSSKSLPSSLGSTRGDSEEEPGEPDIYHSLSIQLLDLMHTLHTRAATIFSSWAEEERQQKEQVDDDDAQKDVPIDAGTSTLWVKCWCPLLQGIAHLCCDARRGVRSQALTYLQRALLVHDLQTLSAVEWENCFNKVLFPLLSKLLEGINPQDPNGMEETRMRASTLLCKVFLQHLTPLLSLSTFTALWLTILDFMDKYMHADKSDLLCEAIPENLKNMLLVMHTAGILQGTEGEESQLWQLTWDRINTFLPTLWEEVFKPHEITEPRRPTIRAEPGAETIVSSTETPKLSPPQEQSPPGSGCPSPVPPDVTDNAPTKIAEVHSRPESPLTSSDNIPTSASYILHPPLASVATPARSGENRGQAGVVPILLNPDIIQGTSIPIISPQSTPERKHEVAAESH